MSAWGLSLRSTLLVVDSDTAGKWVEIAAEMRNMVLVVQRRAET